MQVHSSPLFVSSGFSALATLSACFTLAITLLWLWIAWRAMRAHERIAAQLEQRSKVKAISASDA